MSGGRNSSWRNCYVPRSLTELEFVVGIYAKIVYNQ